MFNIIGKIINRKVIGSIGEPWDFNSTDGQNKFLGCILFVELSADNEQFLLCEISSFKYRSQTINRVLVHVRDKSKFGICNDLLAGERVTCHFIFQPNGLPIDIGSAKKYLIDHPRPEFMIGSLKLEGWSDRLSHISKKII